MWKGGQEQDGAVLQALQMDGHCPAQPRRSRRSSWSSSRSIGRKAGQQLESQVEIVRQHRSVLIIHTLYWR